VLAHRGASRLARENTVEAFRRAREVGADGVELDVRRSADGVPLVHHDASAADGIGLLVARPFAEIRAAAPWLPTLDEALDACAGMLVNVEIKCSRWEPDADPEHIVARAAVDAVREHGTRAIFSSFDLEAVDAVHAYAPDAVTAFLVHDVELRAAAILAREHHHTWLHPNRAAVLAAPEDAVAIVREEQLQVDVWTVDDPDEMRVLAAAGVDAIVTNVPDVALAALAALDGIDG
jgi:glycerophosphoryl diester phosphodiesterase